MTEGFVNGRQVKAQMREELDLQDIDAQESCTKLTHCHLHWIKFVAPILVLKLVLDHMKDVTTRYVSCCILLTDNGILAAAKIVALQTKQDTS